MILHSKLLYLFLIVLVLFICIYKTCIKKYKSVYNGEEEIYVEITKIKFNTNYITLDVRGKEKVKAIYYFKNSNDLKMLNGLKLGDKVLLMGEFVEPRNNTMPNQFNYKKYLYNNKIYYTFKIDNIKLISSNKKIIYKIKNVINNRVNKFDNKTSGYIKAFVLGDSNGIDVGTIKNYRNLGIIHLLSTSGMHISLFTGILFYLLKKTGLKEYIRYLIVFMILIFYMILMGFTPSILRSGIYFIFNSINKLLDLRVNSKKVFILTVSFIILINPFIIYNIGFIFSCVTSGYLIFFRNVINGRKTKLGKSIMVSLIASLSTFPIVVYNYFEINILSIVYNLIFIPIVSTIIFPMSLLSFLITPLSKILLILINSVEYFISIFVNIDSTIILSKPNIILLILYYAVITFVLYSIGKNREYMIFVFIVMVLIHYNYNLLFKSRYVVMLDVGQGDSILFHSNNKTFMVDTGGSFYSNGNISTKLISVLKSFGIRKIDYSIITHGDYDHMGEAINLVNNFKVEKVIFNCGEFNELEQDLIKVLDKNKIPYYSCIKELNLDDNKLYFLNSGGYSNENDNSGVIYTVLNNYKFLLMGDAGAEVEEDLLEKYNLQDIDVLKVGHHGSKTSSSMEFINSIKPKYSIISVGKNNRYGHPNNNVLTNLDNSKIYRTDQDGSIMFKIKNNKLKIETCSP